MRSMYRIILLVCIGLLPIHSFITAQQEVLLSSISLQLEELVDDYVKESFLKHRFPREVDDLRLLFGPKAVDSLSVYNDQAEILAELKVIRNDHGLKLQSSYANNFAGSLLEDDGIFYQWRTFAGLDWDLLNNGLIAQKERALQKKLEYEAELASQNEKIKDFSYRKSFDFIIYTFNKQKIDIIQNRLNILTGLLSVIRSMYYLRYNHWEDVLDIMSKKSETEMFLKTYQTYLQSVHLDSQLISQDISTLPVFDILYTEIAKQGCDTVTSYMVYEKNIQALEHQFHWSKDVSLGAQVRYNYYNGGVAATYKSRDFVTAGLSFSIPIPFNQSAKKEWKEAKQQKIKTDFESYRDGLNNELLNHYHEYEYAHKQYINFFYKKEQLAVTINRSMRKRNLDDPDYSPMVVVDKLDELFSIDLELTDIQQKMYLKALKIFTLINAIDVLPFIDVKDYNLFVSQYKSDRLLFCSAADLRDYDTKFLIEFFRQNGIKEVTVEAGADSDTYLRYAALLDAATRNDLVVRFAIDPLLGTSTLAPDLNTEISLSLTPAIHFDLLAALSDPDNKNYTEIIETMDTYSRAFDISISVPAHIDQLLLKGMLPSVSRIHLVPGHSSQLVGIYQKFQAVTAGQSKSAINLVVRPQDFGSKLELDDFVDELAGQFQLSAVGLYSMKELIGLDKKTVGWYEERRF